MKRHDQSKKATEKFLKESPLYKYLSEYNETHVTRDEVAWLLGTDDRHARLAMAELANYAPILSFSSSKGYRLVIIPEKADKRVLQGYLEAIEHTLREHESRIVNIKARMKPLIAAKKDIEALIEKEG